MNCILYVGLQAGARLVREARSLREAFNEAFN